MARYLEPGALILTTDDARMLYQGAKLKELRERHRTGDDRFYALLHEITKAAFSGPRADVGSEQRHASASEDTRMWTVTRLARATGQSERTIRNACQSGEIPATKAGRPWLIPSTEAHTYIERRRST